MKRKYRSFSSPRGRTMKRRRVTTRGAYSLARRAIKISKKAAMGTSPILHHDFHMSPTLTTTGSISTLSDIGQGITEHLRIGEETRLLSVRLRIAYVNAPEDLATFTRLILFRDTVTANPDVNGVINGVLETNEITSMVRQDNKRRFVILFDKVLNVNKHNTTQIYRTFYLNLRNVKATYDGPANTDTKRGHLYLLFLCNRNTTPAEIDVRSRVYMRSV